MGYKDPMWQPMGYNDPMWQPASKMVPIVRSFYKPLPCCNVTKMPVRVPNAQRANTTKTSEFGAQKGLLQGPGK